MKNLIIIMLIAGAGFQLWGKYSHLLTQPEPLYNEPYIVVYGRNSCGYTQNTLKELKQSGVNFVYQSVDDKSVVNTLHNRMNNSGLDTRRYKLPVVDVNNKLSIRPQSAQIISSYKSKKI